MWRVCIWLFIIHFSLCASQDGLSIFGRGCLKEKCICNVDPDICSTSSIMAAICCEPCITHPECPNRDVPELKQFCEMISVQTHLCYTRNFRIACCKACRHAFTDIEGCEFGDHEKNCDVNHCDDPCRARHCCKTCSETTSPKAKTLTNSNHMLSTISTTFPVIQGESNSQTDPSEMSKSADFSNAVTNSFMPETTSKSEHTTLNSVPPTTAIPSSAIGSSETTSPSTSIFSSSTQTSVSITTNDSPSIIGSSGASSLTTSVASPMTQTSMPPIATDSTSVIGSSGASSLTTSVSSPMTQTSMPPSATDSTSVIDSLETILSTTSTPSSTSKEFMSPTVTSSLLVIDSPGASLSTTSTSSSSTPTSVSSSNPTSTSVSSSSTTPTSVSSSNPTSTSMFSSSPTSTTMSSSSTKPTTVFSSSSTPTSASSSSPIPTSVSSPSPVPSSVSSPSPVPSVPSRSSTQASSVPSTLSTAVVKLPFKHNSENLFTEELPSTTSISTSRSTVRPITTTKTPDVQTSERCMDKFDCRLLQQSECYAKNIENSCCATCESYRSRDENCPYGDMLKACDKMDKITFQVLCASNQPLCCETCKADVKRKKTRSKNKRKKKHEKTKQDKRREKQRKRRKNNNTVTFIIK